MTQHSKDGGPAFTAQSNALKALQFYAAGKHFHGDIIIDRGEKAIKALQSWPVTRHAFRADDNSAGFCMICGNPQNNLEQHFGPEFEPIPSLYGEPMSLTGEADDADTYTPAKFTEQRITSLSDFTVEQLEEELQWRRYHATNAEKDCDEQDWSGLNDSDELDDPRP